MGGDVLRLQDVWNTIIKSNAGISEREFLAKELQEFIESKRRKDMITGRRYYRGNHDIDNKKRTMISESGVIELDNLPNAKIADNKFDDLVDQKVNYLLANQIEVKTENEEIKKIFDKSFHRKINAVARDVYIGGIGYLYPYFENGTLQFKRLPPENVIPFWRDEEHEVLDAFIYFYDIETYSAGGIKKNKTYVEYYTRYAVSYYIYENGMLSVDTNKQKESYIVTDGTEYAWEHVPLIAFKANDIEQPLICRVKCLQDALNDIYSNFVDNMQEDVRSSILVIKNYDGEDLGNFRKNLATYGAVKIRTVDGVSGDVSVLHIDVDSTNYMSIMNALKKSIIENGRGFDAKDDRMSTNPNQMNIMSMYSDIDLDANQLEMQIQASFELLLQFVKRALAIQGVNTDTDVTFIFNRNTPVNESDVINNCRSSVGILSTETIIANHPWTTDTAEELKRLQQEQADAMALVDYVKKDDVNE